MKPYIRTIMIWFLSLSLTGLPLIAHSQGIGSMLPGTQMDNVSHIVPERAVDDMPCHSQNDAVPAGVSADKMTADTSSKNCYCDDDCQCSHDMACQVGPHSAGVAILLSSRLVSSLLDSSLVKEVSVVYHDCDTDAEIIPPIV